MNPYVSLDTFKERGVLNIEGSTDDARFIQILEAVSREMDGFTRRHFYSLTDTRFFSGNDRTRILLDWDIIAVNTLKEDDNGSGSYNVTWSSTDYELSPYEANPTGETDRSRPYEAIEVNLRGNGSQDVFLKGQKRYEIQARFGYNEHTDDVGVNVSSSGAFESSATTFLVGAEGLGSTKIEVGMTLKIGSEQMYVTALVSGSSATATVTRAVNGTTVSSHAASADIQVYRYPQPIVEAVIEQATRLWTRRGQGYANIIGFTETGQVGPTVTGIDRDVRELIRPYVKLFA